MLPTISEGSQISLGEGNTPLLRARNIGRLLGLENLYFKLENLNPTGSYKDRFAAVAISNVLQMCKDTVLATSSGNTGAALAAYAAAAGLSCKIALVDGAPFGKLQQMGVYGAQLYMIKDFGLTDTRTYEVMDYLKKLAVNTNSSLEISAYRFSPVGMEGVQTIAFELAEELPGIKHVFVPAGGGGLFLSMQLGFSKWRLYNDENIQPKLYCVQPQGNDTIASVLSQERVGLEALSKSTTEISGLQVPSLLDAPAIVAESFFGSCSGALVQDTDVYDCQRLLAEKEGIFCEPAGAVALSGLKRALTRGEIKTQDPVVCLVTGNGAKDVKALDRLYSPSDCLYLENIDDTSLHFGKINAQ
ncbi:pyridoxal-phosphate dependent enzyme [Sphingobacterium sp. SYP-B4668]|uniref:pyridoxal-phosphate dependent enzyme n=1 Tax=Sphingobacterium sp. SYP-B4668 TaxID=2996035 RepID=UPI0022DDFF35|nr:pyridoxal-phosphate dependent enzyme [Sphingobacterium sp. SYP-B4668]